MFFYFNHGEARLKKQAVNPCVNGCIDTHTFVPTSEYAAKAAPATITMTAKKTLRWNLSSPVEVRMKNRHTGDTALAAYEGHISAVHFACVFPRVEVLFFDPYELERRRGFKYLKGVNLKRFQMRPPSTHNLHTTTLRRDETRRE